MTGKNALVVISDWEAPTLLNSEDVMEEMDGLQFNFTNVKVPSGGGMAFELPGDDDDEPDIVKELEGVIVHHHPINVYFAAAYDGEKQPPDCVSMDGKFGTGEPGGECANCELNQWGTGRDGEGKACSNRRRVYLLRRDEMFPLLISLPPTSLKNFSDLISRKILQKSRRSNQVVVTAKLKKVTSGSGIEYSQIGWAVTGQLDHDTALAMKRYGESIKALAGGLTVDQVEGEAMEGAGAGSVQHGADFPDELIDSKDDQGEQSQIS